MEAVGLLRGARPDNPALKDPVASFVDEHNENAPCSRPSRRP